MPRIDAISATEATDKARQLLAGVDAKLGVTPNMMKTMAHSPTVLGAYLNFSGALAGVLDEPLRTEIAIAVAQGNSCEYCLSVHAMFGKSAGLGTEELALSRESLSQDAKRQAALQFAQQIVARRGEVSDQDLAALRQAGYTDAEITAIVAHVALNIFTNYFNLVAQTEVDFPRVPLALAQHV